MESLDYWRLCDELSIMQAALLLDGINPSIDFGDVECWSREERPKGYDAAKAAISTALGTKAIKGKVVPICEYDLFSEKHEVIEDSIDPKKSTVEVESLRAWLTSRGFQTGFFFPTATDAPDYLDPRNPRYAPKLAAAVSAWQSVTDPKGKTPKQALMEWLREHAAEFDLFNDEGKPNELGIDEVAKVANWKRGGGAPKTPGE